MFDRIPVACAAVVLSSTAVQARITFVDVAVESTTGAFSFGRGAAFADIDGDGLLDIVAANDGMENFFLRQRPDHTFEDATAHWGLAIEDRSSWGVLVADFDEDGDPDVYFINGGFPGQRNQLFRNDIDTGGTLTDVLPLIGAGGHPYRNFGGTTLDYDNDGDLDIFVTTPNAPDACALLRNDGDLFFTDVSAEAGIVETGSHRHCSMGDYNNDGLMDIGVGAYFGANLLYRNNGDGTFTNVAAEAGVESPDFNFGVVFEDFDNDGWQDILLPKYLVDPGRDTTELYRNNGDGTFTDVTAGSGMTGQTDMGHNTGDVDADGYPDILIGTGNPSFPDDPRLFLMGPVSPDRLVGLDVSVISGLTSSGQVRCHGIALGDYDQDGDVDVYMNNGGPSGYPEVFEPNYLWQSLGNDHRWTAIRLTGTVSNRSAIGARCEAVTNTGRSVHRMRRAGNGFANSDSPVQHFGIGDDAFVERITITWPSGIVQTIEDPPMFETLDVVEPCAGDADDSGEVNLDDLIAVLTDWGTDGSASDGDLNGSGMVDVDDLTHVLLNWGPC